MYSIARCKGSAWISQSPGASSAPELRTRGAGLLDFDAPRVAVDDDDDDEDLTGAYRSEKERGGGRRVSEIHNRSKIKNKTWSQRGGTRR